MNANRKRPLMESYLPAIPIVSGKGSRLLVAAVAVTLLAAPYLMPNAYWLRIYTMTGLYVMLALGLNVVAGFAGLLDLSYVAFFGIGGYLFALLSSGHFDIHLPFWLVLPLGALTTMGFGLALGATSIRLKGDYLAIVTLAFAQIFKLLLLNLDRPVNITGGVNGIYNLDPIHIIGFRLITPTAYAYLIWGFAALAVIASFRIKGSRYGRGWEAIREDELAAETVGVNTTWWKLAAFAGGAFVAGGTGVLFASFQDSVFPNNFDFQQLVIIYCMVILGGMGNIAGVALGAILLSILPEFLREYGAYRMMFFGLILVVLMILRPQGLLGEVGLFKKGRRRPDKDETGLLKASTELYYRNRIASEEAVRYAPSDRVVLELEKVTLNFGGIRAVDNLSFHLQEGEILSIIGPNGAGKTTVFNVISGIYPLSAGRVIHEGKDITGLKPHRIVQSGIARTFQNLRIFNNLSVLENAKAARVCRTKAGPLSILFHLPRHLREEAETDHRAKEILALFGARLTGYRFDQAAQFLSYANRRRLEIARAMATDARILLLDEPAAGMNPQETIEITGFIRELRDLYGYTILLIEHKLGLVKTVSDRVIALDSGVKIAEGDYASVAGNQQVIEAYLGRKHAGRQGMKIRVGQGVRSTP